MVNSLNKGGSQFLITPFFYKDQSYLHYDQAGFILTHMGNGVLIGSPVPLRPLP